MSQRGRKSAKKALHIIANAALYLFLTLCLLTLTLSIFSERSDGAVTLFGKVQLRIVLSPSMESNDDTDVSDFEIKSIPVRSMVFVSTVPTNEAQARLFYDGLKEGDVLTFKYVYSQQETITHRLIRKEPNGSGGYLLYLKGDNSVGSANADVQIVDTDDEMGLNYIVGKVTGQSVVLGNVVYAVQQPVGLALIVIVPCAAIIIAETVRIVNVLAARKRERAEAENKRLADEAAAKETEIEQLKKRLSELSAATQSAELSANNKE